MVVEYKKINDFKIGQYHEEQFIVTEEEGRRFAEITKDFNPIHLDETYVQNFRFGKKIVHGMLVGGFISGVIGNKFPGPGSVYMGQDFWFRKPIFYNTKIIVRVEIVKIDHDKKRIYLKTVCKSESGEMLIEGNAKVMLDN